MMKMTLYITMIYTGMAMCENSSIPNKLGSVSLSIRMVVQLGAKKPKENSEPVLSGLPLL